VTPDFCPEPIAWGTFEWDSNAHFYICKFYDFTEGVPEPNSFCEHLARLHVNSSSPNNNFGFHCVTYNGDLPQDNTWTETWEQFFANALRNVLEIREQRAGRKSEELEALLPTLFEEIIPRLLRPLESDGRSIKPSLVHGDLWYGNAGIVNDDTEEGIIYDPSSFYAHNECQLFNPVHPTVVGWTNDGSR
jgi:protein-ribulosamine 3-kinase